jgi:hypothetical protein
MRIKIIGKIVLLAMFAFLASSCVTTTGNRSAYIERPVPPNTLNFKFINKDKTFALRTDNNTPLNLDTLPATEEILYKSGLDPAKKRQVADIQLDLSFRYRIQENPGLRAGNALGGALIGTAIGAVIGAIAGDPAGGAAVGAATGGLAGAVAPAGSNTVEVNLCLAGKNGRLCQSSFNIDVTNIDQYEIASYIDQQIANLMNRTMLQ